MENQEKTSEKPELLRDDRGKLLPGQKSLNPTGRPKGKNSFKKRFFAVIDKVGEKNGITADEVEEQLILVGLKKAQGGNEKFWNSIFDRVYGKPHQTIDMTTDDEPITDIKINIHYANGIGRHDSSGKELSS